MTIISKRLDYHIIETRTYIGLLKASRLSRECREILYLGSIIRLIAPFIQCYQSEAVTSNWV